MKLILRLGKHRNLDYYKKRPDNYDIGINSGLIAEAISIVSEKIDLDKDQCCDKTYHINEKILIDDNVYLFLYSYRHVIAYMNAGLLSTYQNDFRMGFYTVVGNTKMADYNVLLDNKSKEPLYREWELEYKVIHHYLPSFIAIIINDWAKNIVSIKHEELQKENDRRKDSLKKRWDEEEKKIDEVVESMQEGEMRYK